MNPAACLCHPHHIISQNVAKSTQFSLLLKVAFIEPFSSSYIINTTKLQVTVLRNSSSKPVISLSELQVSMK
jgi:hypothetical protein